MDTETFYETRKTLESICKTILDAKGQAYAQEAVCHDRLGNFKRQAEHWGIQPPQAIGVYLGKHYDSVQTWVREASECLAKGEPLPTNVGDEPIETRIADLRNYVDLLYAWFVEASQPGIIRFPDLDSNSMVNIEFPTFDGGNKC